LISVRAFFVCHAYHILKGLKSPSEPVDGNRKLMARVSSARRNLKEA